MATFITRVPYFSGWDIAGVIVNTILQILLWYLSNKARGMLLQWSDYDRKLAESLNEAYGCDKGSKT